MGNLPVQNAAFEHIPPRLAGALSPGSRAAGAEIGDAAFEQVAHRDKAVLAETDAGRHTRRQAVAGKQRHMRREIGEHFADPEQHVAGIAVLLEARG